MKKIKNRKIKKVKKGFSLVEVLIVMFIAAVAFTSFYTVATFGTKYIIESKNRLAAVAFLNERMEIVRNLEYNDVGIEGSIDVDGILPQETDAIANGRSYHISNSVAYIDDPLDGVWPADTIQNDYKIVRVVVSWNDSNGQLQSVSSSSRFVPPGLETSVGGSPLSINVIDGTTLLPISQATVHITNNTMSPPIDDTIQTDTNGHIMLPVAKISNDTHLSITKTGYETIETMDSSPTFIPIYGHINVIEGFLNTYNYLQNKLGDLIVKTADYQGNPVGDLGFTIGGGKVIGHDEVGVEIFSMANEVGTTNATTGEKEYSDISSGNYSILMSPDDQYEFIDYDPSVSPAFLVPDSVTTHTLRVADKSVSALFLTVVDIEDMAPIANAKVTLTDGAADIFTEKLSSLRGVVFYPDDAATLENKEYTLKVEAEGYTQDTKTINISNLTHIGVSLTKL